MSLKYEPSSEPLQISAKRLFSHAEGDGIVVRIHFIFVMIRWTGLAPWGEGFGVHAEGDGVEEEALPDLALPFHPLWELLLLLYYS